MKKRFEHSRVGKLLKSKAFKTVADVVLGVVAPSLKLGTGVVGGVVAGVGSALKHEKDTNLTSEGGGMNKPNYARIVGYVIFAGLVALLVLGKIDKETFDFLFDYWETATEG